MSYEEPQSEQRSRPVVAYVIGAVVIGVGALLLVRYLGASKSPVGTTGPKATQQEDHLDSAREVLTKARDVTACQVALSHFNQYLIQHPEKNPGRLAPVAAFSTASRLR